MTYDILLGGIYCMARIPELPDYAYCHAKEIVDNPMSVSSLDYRKAAVIVVAKEFDSTVDKISKIFNISRATYFRFRDDIIAEAENGGEPVKQPWGGRRNSLMTEKEEKNFLYSFEKDAREGKLISAVTIQRALEEKTGHSVAHSTVSRMLERNNWRKVAPDTKHPKSDEKEQENFKKKCRHFWQPPSKKINKT
jgi:transposase